MLVSLVIVGGGATYYAKKEVILNKLPKPSSKPEVYQEIKKPGAGIPAPKAELAKRSVNFEAKGTEVEGLPNINMFPPAGWNQISAEGADVLAFEASDKDYIYAGKSNLWTLARISVRVTKSTGESLQDAVNQYKNQMKDLMPTAYTFEQKTLLGSNEVYYLEADHDLRDISRKQYEEQVRKSGKSVSNADMANLTKMLEIERIRSATYFMQKNGYDVVVSGRASAVVWDKRGEEIKKSIASLVFIGK